MSCHKKIKNYRIVIVNWCIFLFGIIFGILIALKNLIEYFFSTY
jgi:hypothetical protein